MTIFPNVRFPFESSRALNTKKCTTSSQISRETSTQVQIVALHLALGANQNKLLGAVYTARFKLTKSLKTADNIKDM